MGRSPGGGSMGSMGVLLILGVLLFLWAIAGFYIVDPAEQGVVTRFGKYHRTSDPGPHWMPYFIDDVEKVNVQLVRTAEIGFRTTGRSQGSVGTESLMLTQDENIVDVKFAAQYRVKDARNYLFNVRDPDLTLRQATESAVREIVGKSTLDFVITEGRSAVAATAKDLTQEILDRYGTGLVVTSLNMQDAQPPAQVQEAFYDAVKAREDEVRARNEAEAYANDILPKSRGDADALREQSEGYKQRVIALAEGETTRFNKILAEYNKAPEVTRERLYLEAKEQVLGSTSKVLMGAEGNNNLLYLPLDQLMRQVRPDSPTSGEGAYTGSTVSAPATSDSLRRQREDVRGGRGR
jgi:membrane protease subunit HflK